MRTLFGVVCGGVFLVLALTAPALARPLYQSNLLCVPPSQAFGFAVIGTSGDLYVRLTGVEPSQSFVCEITCAGPGSASATCGPSSTAGILTTIVPGLAFDPSLPAVCEDPAVSVVRFTGTGTLEVCVSAYRKR